MWRSAVLIEIPSARATCLVCRPRADALSMVGVKPYLLPLVGAQRPGLLPDPRVDRHPAKVVEKPCPSDRRHTHRIDPALLCRRSSELRDADGVAGEGRRDQVG